MTKSSQFSMHHWREIHLNKLVILKEWELGDEKALLEKFIQNVPINF